MFRGHFAAVTILYKSQTASLFLLFILIIVMFYYVYYLSSYRSIHRLKTANISTADVTVFIRFFFHFLNVNSWNKLMEVPNELETTDRLK